LPSATSTAPWCSGRIEARSSSSTARSRRVTWTDVAPAVPANLGHAELGRPTVTGADAHRIMKIRTWYDTLEATLLRLGQPPVRGEAERGFLTPCLTGPTSSMAPVGRTT
jgi:hypothetical protein